MQFTTFSIEFYTTVLKKFCDFCGWPLIPKSIPYKFLESLKILSLVVPYRGLNFTNSQGLASLANATTRTKITIKYIQNEK
jgi:hypothetical protein